MGRERSSRTLDRRAMHASRHTQVELLLPTGSGRCIQSHADEEDRRDLHSTSILWISQYDCGIEERRSRNQSETHSKPNANNGTGRATAWTVYLKAASTAPEIPLFIKRFTDFETPPSMEYRHYVHSVARGLCISHGCNRLVQQNGVIQSTIEQPGELFLHRSSGRGARAIWATGDFQYRSRSAIHQRRVHAGNPRARDSVQHGWKRPSSRQHFRRASMEICKV
jgi:hypothetical protein